MFIGKSQTNGSLRLMLRIAGHVQRGSYRHSALEEGAMQFVSP